MLTKEVKIFERLKIKNDINAVYKKGKVFISVDRKLKANHLFSESVTNRVRVAITISSKAGNSVWRNRLRRIIRESLRREKKYLREIMNNNKQGLSIIFSTYRINQVNFEHLSLKDVKPAVTDILNKISKTAIRN
jgi:ribonuclease P protein component